MTILDDEIAALPKMPEWKGGTIKLTYPDYMAEDLPEVYLVSVVGAYQARLALVRRVLQEIVEYVEADSSDEPYELLADARKVLEVTKP